MKNHVKHLNRVRRHAAKALRSFTRTERRLSRVNDKIDRHVADVEAAIGELNVTRTALTLHKDSNSHVLTQIGGILRPGNAQ